MLNISAATLLVALLAITACTADIQTPASAVEALQDMYDTCLSRLSTGCVRPKALRWIDAVADSDEIRITDDLSVVRTGAVAPTDERRSSAELYDQIDNFLGTHSLRMRVPAILKTAEARSFGSEQLGLDTPLELPLSEEKAVEGRGFVKKVMIPFLLGLKFKTTVLLPLAFALIALKTWKATTLGLLSMVLSAAMVIFKFAKPKVVNYEVVHYPHHHVEHHLDHHLEHHLEPHPHHIEHVHVEHPHPPPGWEPAHGWARSDDGVDAQQLAYAGPH